MSTIAQTNRSLSVKTVDKFYVSFFNLPENISNILGREAQSVERPTIAFDEMEIRRKGIRNVETARITYQPITINFTDDSHSLVTKALYEQVHRQAGTGEDKSKLFEKSRFNFSVKVYSSDEKIVEEFNVIDCRITNISHSEQITTDSTDNIISVTIAFNGLDYKFPELDK